MMIALCLLIAPMGCQKSNPWDHVVAADGQVKFEGTGIEGAQLTLYPTAPGVPASIRPSAVTTGGGNFFLGTHGAADGVPPGEYKVSVVWHQLVDVGSGPTRGDNVLPARYADPESSGVTVVINETETSIPAIELKK